MTGLQKRRPGQWITMIGFCVAMEVILARFLSLHTWNLKIGFSFLPVVAAALWGGPLAGGITGALGDLIGALLFPVGAYFPGFTLSSFLDGAIYGWCFRKGTGKRQILLAVLLVQVAISLLLNTFWLTVLFQCAAGIVIKFLMLSLVLPVLRKHLVPLGK